MRILRTALAKILTLMLFSVCLAAPARAQFGTVIGDLRDHEGKPYPNVTIVFKNTESGQTLETKSDKNGRFTVMGLRSGIWNYSCQIKERYGSNYEGNFRMVTGGEERLDINLKTIMAGQSAARAEEIKKREEEAQKAQGMKAHFDTGRASLDQAIATRNEIQRTPAADRGPLTEKLGQLSTTAITELEAAQQTAAPTDPNMHIVVSNLGQAYEIATRYDDAVAAFSKAIELKPEIPGYYQALGTAQARLGKVTDAMATCDRAAALPATAGAADAASVTASCYGNVGIILQNGARMKESIEPLKKATTVNPSNADYWFLLARGLVNAMEYKTEGTTMKTIIQPGTAEAYQKYLELAPTGRFAQDAKDGLAMLEAIAPGIQTKVTAKKKKS